MDGGWYVRYRGGGPLDHLKSPAHSGTDQGIQGGLMCEASAQRLYDLPRQPEKTFCESDPQFCYQVSIQPTQLEPLSGFFGPPLPLG